MDRGSPSLHSAQGLLPRSGSDVAALRVALVGCGFWAAQAHLPALRELPEVEVVACVGRDDEEARTFATAQGIASGYASIDQLLAKEPLDALVVSTPDDLHVGAVEAAFGAGIAVFCEKPLANLASEAWRLTQMLEDAGVVATVGYSFRYSPAVQALRGDFRSGALGTAWLVELYEYNAQFHPRGGKPMNWKGDPRHARAGALFEYGSHAVDIAHWIVGPAERVVSAQSRVLQGARLDDVATVLMDFGAPTLGTLTCGWVLAGEPPGLRVRVHGSEGAAEAVLDQSLPGGEAYRRLSVDGRPVAERELPFQPELGRSRYAVHHLGDFCRALRGHPPIFSQTMPTFEEAARVQTVLDTVLEATDLWRHTGISELGHLDTRSSCN
jgi:predicted dehydrogenase